MLRPRNSVETRASLSGPRVRLLALFRIKKRRLRSMDISLQSSEDRTFEIWECKQSVEPTGAGEAFELAGSWSKVMLRVVPRDPSTEGLDYSLTVLPYRSTAAE